VGRGDARQRSRRRAGSRPTLKGRGNPSSHHRRRPAAARPALRPPGSLCRPHCAARHDHRTRGEAPPVGAGTQRARGRADPRRPTPRCPDCRTRRARRELDKPPFRRPPRLLARRRHRFSGLRDRRRRWARASGHRAGRRDPVIGPDDLAPLSGARHAVGAALPRPADPSRPPVPPRLDWSGTN